MRWSCLIVLLLASVCLCAQESQLAADFRHEGDHIRENCGKFGLKTIAPCGQELVTDHPLHLALGSIAPQNGFGFGPAFVAHHTPNESWRLFFNVDAVATSNQSWRTGAYMTAVLTRHRTITQQPGGGSQPSRLRLEQKPVFHVYAQST